MRRHSLCDVSSESTLFAKPHLSKYVWMRKTIYFDLPKVGSSLAGHSDRLQHEYGKILSSETVGKILPSCAENIVKVNCVKEIKEENCVHLYIDLALSPMSFCS